MKRAETLDRQTACPPGDDSRASETTTMSDLREQLSLGSGWREQITWAASRTRAVVLNEGLGPCLRRIANKLARALRGQGRLTPYETKDRNLQYRRWRERRRLTGEDLCGLREEVARLASRPAFVFAMPLASARMDWITAAIESFRTQVYPHWELRICGDERDSRALRRTIEQIAGADERITFTQCASGETTRRRAWSLLAESSGAFIGLIGQHDELAPEALLAVAKRVDACPGLELVYSDHDVIAPDGEYVDPFFKPDWSPDLLLSMDYLSPFCLFRREALLEAKDWDASIGGHGLHGLFLRFTDEPRRVGHLPLVLCHARAGRAEGGPADDRSDLQQTEGAAAVTEALRRRGESGAASSLGPGPLHVTFEVAGSPLVSIIIPTRDRADLLERCIGSIERYTGEVRYEVIVVDNGSTEARTLRYLDAIAGRHRVIRRPGPFNYSAINNEGVAQAAGEFLLFLNNDTEALSPRWLSAMVAQAQRPGVGAVGAKLLYPDGRIQHAGVVLGLCGVAGHAFRYCRSGSLHDHGLSDSMRNCSAVTAACMLMPKALFEKLGGFNPRLKVEYNDVDLCLRIRRQGYRIVFAPDAALYHHENATRRGGRSPEDEALMRELWGDLLAEGDPYYNPNLTLVREDWSLHV